MKNWPLLMATLLSLQIACTHSHDKQGSSDHAHGDADHVHDADGNHVLPESAKLESLEFTEYSDKTELFVEFKPLIVGYVTHFAAHFTLLGDVFTAVDKGKVTVLLKGVDSEQSFTADQPSVPGIFRLKLTPEKTGEFDLHFIIQTPTYSDTISLYHILVYESINTAMADVAEHTTADDDISYLKEQAWKVEFSNAPARIIPFSEVVKTSGQLLAAPGDESVLVTQINGTVAFTGKSFVAGNAIKAGTTLFSVKSNEVTQSNLGSAVTQAENDVATAEKNYNRALELIGDKIISEKEFQETKLRLDQARAHLSNVSVSKNYNRNRQQITAPISGFIKHIAVENGQFVQAGQPLATITKNKKLMLRADVSQRYFSKISTFNAANFKSSHDDRVYNTRDLNGKMVSFGKSTAIGSPFVPLYFELDNSGNFISGTVVEVFLQSGAKPALVIPVSALLEEQGIFYAYVQVGGERFQKRELKTGASDGMHVEIISGISAGERVVTKGAYHIKLSTASGALPEHGHEH